GPGASGARVAAHARTLRRMAEAERRGTTPRGGRPQAAGLRLRLTRVRGAGRAAPVHRPPRVRTPARRLRPRQRDPEEPSGRTGVLIHAGSIRFTAATPVRAGLPFSIFPGGGHGISYAPPVTDPVRALAERTHEPAIRPPRNRCGNDGGRAPGTALRADPDARPAPRVRARRCR